MKYCHSWEIASSELPICDRARRHYSQLWHISNAQDFCKALLNLAAVPSITISEYMHIATVAGGDMWPVPDSVYTREDWNRDGSMNAVPGQEIEPGIYEQMFNVLPPLPLPICSRSQSYDAGFMVSEPFAADPMGRGELYAAYAKRGERCYFVGLLPRQRRRTILKGDGNNGL